MSKYITFTNKINDDTRKIKLSINVPLWITIPVVALIAFLIWKR